jgi:hypothetical protein
MRRVVLEDPLARSAIWSRNLAVFALCVAAIGILLSRKGLDPQAALAIVAGSLGLAGLAIFFAFVAMAVIWQTGFRGIGLALAGLALSACLFAYPALIAVEARTKLAVTDVSTDLDDPPLFLSTKAALEARHGLTPAAKISAANRARQEQLYPDLQTLTLDADPSDVVDVIHKLVKHNHWTIADEVAPDEFTTGHIDVVATSLLMGFPIDITFRLRQVGNQTHVDIRSVARSGWQEQPGSNAARVKDLESAIEDSISES